MNGIRQLSEGNMDFMSAWLSDNDIEKLLQSEDAEAVALAKEAARINDYDQRCDDAWRDQRWPL